MINNEIYNLKLSINGWIRKSIVYVIVKVLNTVIL
jgi:hypothetical protein